MDSNFVLRRKMERFLRCTRDALHCQRRLLKPDELSTSFSLDTDSVYVALSGRTGYLPSPAFD
jgi:hypothetical protein